MKKQVMTILVTVIVLALVVTVVGLSLQLSSVNQQKNDLKKKYSNTISKLTKLAETAREVNNNYMQMAHIINKEGVPNSTFWKLYLSNMNPLELLVVGIMGASGASSQETRRYLDDAQNLAE